MSELVYTLKTDYTKTTRNHHNHNLNTNNNNNNNISPLNYFVSNSNFTWGGMLPLHIACRISIPQILIESILSAYPKGNFVIK